MSFEANFDGLVGPTHNYAGIAVGNEASRINAGGVSNPREAALQGLAKMKLLHDRGLKQGVFPPHPRPYLPLLRELGFQNVSEVAKQSPHILPHIYSSSGMWAANAATVSPSADTADHTLHFTPANLVTTAHRSIEPDFSHRMLKAIFVGNAFRVHPPLPKQNMLADEGAANHMRLNGGLNIFVYGSAATKKYPARQTKLASEAIARNHGLDPAKTLFLEQNPAVIDQGVFHNDVIAVSHENIVLYHEEAFTDPSVLEAFIKQHGLVSLKIATKDLSVEEAVKSYLFNSQLVTTPDGIVYIAPKECEENRHAKTVIDRLVQSPENPISAVQFVDLKQSMKNGGGPACLRLRVTCTEAEWAAVHDGVKFSDSLYSQLTQWVKTHYRERISPEDLQDPNLALESAAALNALEGILNLKGLYDND